MKWPSDRPVVRVRKRDRTLRAEVDEELQFHLDETIAELQSRGMSAEAARYEATRRMGDVRATRKACLASDQRREKHVHRRQWLDELRRDLTIGLRQLAARPGFAIVIVLMLSVAIGGATAIVGGVEQILFRPLPYARHDRVVALWERDARSGEMRQLSPGNFIDWERRSGAYESIGLAQPYSIDLTGVYPPVSLPALLVTQGFFPALGVRAERGRLFEPIDYKPGAFPVAVLSHAFWDERFGGDAAIVGKIMNIDGRATRVIGVLPAAADYPEATALWVPKRFDAHDIADRTSAYMYGAARLREGATLAAAESEAAAIASQLATSHAKTNRDRRFVVVPFEEELFGKIRVPLYALLIAAALLLLIACANVANLLLARGSDRAHELAVRAAIGGTRARLARQLLTESAVLGLISAGAGVALAIVSLRALRRFAPRDLPRLDAIAFDAGFIVYAIAISVGTVALFSVIPALLLSRGALAPLLRSRGAAVVDPHRVRLRGALLTLQVALALVLLIGAGLLARSFLRLVRNDPGFAAERRVAVQMFLWDRNPTAEARRARANAFLRKLGAIPGVDGVAAVSSLPFHESAIRSGSNLRLPGEPPASEGSRVYTTFITPAFFEVMSIPLRRGRAFDARDGADAPAVAIVNETLARTFFPTADPLGKEVIIGVMGKPRPRRIVGIVADIRATDFATPPAPELYVPHAQSSTGSLTFVVRGTVRAAALVEPIRRAVWEVDRMQTVYDLATLEDIVGETVRREKFYLALIGAFSIVAVVLCIVGVYGLMTYVTRQRAKEMAIRAAVGATPRRLVLMLASSATGWAVRGVLGGVAAALLLTRHLQEMLYDTPARDPLTYAQFVGVLLLLFACATVVPALRIVRTAPARVLREE